MGRGQVLGGTLVANFSVGPRGVLRPGDTNHFTPSQGELHFFAQEGVSLLYTQVSTLLLYSSILLLLHTVAVLVL